MYYLVVLLCFSYFILLMVDVIDATAIDNAVAGEPSVLCFLNGLKLRFQTRNPFAGRVYVRGMSENAQCGLNFSNPVTEIGIEIIYEECIHDMENMSSPPGLSFTMEIVAQFHQYFITRADRSFVVQCVYKEDVNSVSQSISIDNEISTVELAYAPRMPQCFYSINADSPDGPQASFAHVGEKLYHKWKCDPASDGKFHGMLVHSCTATDPIKGGTVELLDKKGCTVDKFAMNTPVYSPNLTMAYVEVLAFKFAEGVQIGFRCEITMCLVMDNRCDGITPPTCDGLRDNFPTTGSNVASPPAFPNYITTPVSGSAAVSGYQYASSVGSYGRRRRPQVFKQRHREEDDDYDEDNNNNEMPIMSSGVENVNSRLISHLGQQLPLSARSNSKLVAPPATMTTLYKPAFIDVLTITSHDAKATGSSNWSTSTTTATVTKAPTAFLLGEEENITTLFGSVLDDNLPTNQAFSSTTSTANRLLETTTMTSSLSSMIGSKRKQRKYRKHKLTNNFEDMQQPQQHIRDDSKPLVGEGSVKIRLTHDAADGDVDDDDLKQLRQQQQSIPGDFRSFDRQLDVPVFADLALDHLDRSDPEKINLSVSAGDFVVFDKKPMLRTNGSVAVLRGGGAVKTYPTNLPNNNIKTRVDDQNEICLTQMAFGEMAAALVFLFLSLVVLVAMLILKTKQNRRILKSLTSSSSTSASATL